MRLVIKIAPKTDTPQPLDQYYLQSCIYNLLQGTEFGRLHNFRRYKYFCFSNIFPYRIGCALEKGKAYTFLISSPNSDLLQVCQNKLKRERLLRLGKFEFVCRGCRTARLNIKPNSALATSSPVIASIPFNLYKKYGIESKRDYLYWNSKMPLNAFVEAVSKNAVRKFNRFYRKNYNEDCFLFKTYKFKRGAIVKYKNSDIAGSVWEFTPADDRQSLEILNFILDAGLGEKNSAGFGFLNIQ